ncbi:SMP-30/gluconolactonase/LRE family protein [Vibrio casei]|uniref:SMP-30/gluconolactonase/LRE family protein n=1 Tax=Vibrio casei TaxID=673372 RepID=A0A368LJJ3_9VIBR|nr:SMP-30/gluconolactonase/LRE family protein [Vibrio casei]RCS70805.1 SMP-30/gluconolactonase/LRE family protein [Vibrio casei]SJN30288.1 Gluconolactonase [Vibrio casei]
MKNIIVNLIPSPLCEIGESPIWLASDQCLFWVDTESFHIHQYSPSLELHQVTTVPVAVTAIAPTTNQNWMAATKHGLYRCNRTFEHFEFIADPTEGKRDIRLNDAVNCPNGDLWFGTMNEQQLDQPDGCIYRYQARDHSIQQLDQDYSVANGIAFNPELKRAYVSNMFKGQVIELQMNHDWSTVLHKRVFIQLKEHQGLPDGLTTDAMGNLYICHWNKGCISIYNSLGELLHTIELPVKHATRCTFGGKNLDSLFITTGWYEMTEQERVIQPLSGRTFVCRGAVIPSPFCGKEEYTFLG